MRVEKNQAIGNKKQIDYDAARTTLKIAIKQALNEAKNEQQLKDKLNDRGIQLISNAAGNGYSIKYLETSFKASEISRDLSFANIQKQLQNQLKPDKTMDNNGLNRPESNLERIARLKNETGLGLNTQQEDKSKRKDNELGYGN